MNWCTMAMTTDIRPFEIHFGDERLSDLRARLSMARFPDQPQPSRWEYGTDLAFLQELVAYWIHDYDWRLQEEHLNSFPQFTTRIDGYDVHFLYARGKGSTRTPLLMTHGWPSSFVEMLAILPLLSESFDVVVPSVIGYGFSSAPTAPGFVPIHDIWAKLMTERLGYDRFIAQGGDIGSGITTALARSHPDRLLAIALQAVQDPVLGPDAVLTEAEQQHVERRARWVQTEGAYGAQQRTKPQTLAYGLNDSPVGLAAWIVEKFRAWSDCNGDVESVFSKDYLLNNIMIYWMTQSIASSVRYYYEWAKHHAQRAPSERIAVPTAVTVFPRDISTPPREWAERTYNVQRYSLMPRGGHFAAHEQPELLAGELRQLQHLVYA